MGTQTHGGCPRSDPRQTICQALGLPSDLHVDTPEVNRGRAWTRDGIDGVELSWAVPAETSRTQGWLLTPADHTGHDLPAVLLLHGHDGLKFYGKEKVADGPDGPAPGIPELRRRGYDGRSVAAGLVAAGFAVLIHDVFPWGSRRVEWDNFPERARAAAQTHPESDRYEAAAREHEHGLAKLAALTGSSIGGRVLVEDIAALNILGSTPGIDSSRIATAGFSGGGARVAHLLAARDHATAPLKAAVVTAMTSTFADIANGHADDTTWLMITPGLPAVCDWPDVITSAAPLPILVQFAREDRHFSVTGMLDAEAALQRAYRGTDALATQWFPHGHRFSSDMQDDAMRWMRANV